MIKIEQIPQIIETGIYTSYKVEKQLTVVALLKELNLESKFFGILVNGKKADKDTIIKATDEVIILPNIAGGA